MKSFHIPLRRSRHFQNRTANKKAGELLLRPFCLHKEALEAIHKSSIGWLMRIRSPKNGVFSSFPNGFYAIIPARFRSGLAA